MPRITPAEKKWCTEFGGKIGIQPKFFPRWDPEVAVVEYELGKDRVENRMELRKFVGTDCPDGWTAYLFRYGCCYKQGDPDPADGARPQTPAEAVGEIVRLLREDALEKEALAARLGDARAV